MMYSFTLRKIILALSFLALDAMADDWSLIDAQAHGNQIISSGWTLDEGRTNEPRLQQASDFAPPIINNEFREPGAQAEPIPPGGGENALPEGSTSEFNPYRKTRPTTMRKLINEKYLRPTTDVSVCNYHEGLTIPICAPYFVTSADATA